MLVKNNLSVERSAGDFLLGQCLEEKSEYPVGFETIWAFAEQVLLLDDKYLPVSKHQATPM